MVAGSTQNVTGRSGDANVFLDFQPSAASTAPVYLNAGDPLTDVLHVSTANGGTDWIPNVTARFDVKWLYYPTAQAAATTAPAGGTVAGTATATAKASLAGYYYPVASFTKATQDPANQQFFTGDWAAGFSDPNEQSMVKYTPKVATKTAEIKDGTIADTITVSDSYPTQKLSIVSDLILTSECTVGDAGQDKAPADAQTVGTVTTEATGNTTVTTKALPIPWDRVVALWAASKPACLSWHETIAATPTTNAWAGKYLVSAETTVLTKPTIVTKASPGGVVPLTVHDTGVLSGTVPSGPGVTVSTMVDLYKWGNDVTPSVQPVCQNKYWSSPWQAVTAPGDITYPEVQIKDMGTYGFVETLKVSVAGTETVLHTGKCGAEGETVVATEQAVTVTPAAASIVPLADTGYKGPDPVIGAIDGNAFLPLELAGGALVLAGLAIAAGVLIRRKHQTANGETADTGIGEPTE